MTSNEHNFWQHHSLRFLEMAFRTDRHGPSTHADVYGIRTGSCGDTVEMALAVCNNHIRSVTFRCDGCIHTNACANTVCHLAEGRSIANAWRITAEQVIAYLETLPADNFHCAELAVGAFYLALSQYKKHKKNRC